MSGGAFPGVTCQLERFMNEEGNEVEMGTGRIIAEDVDVSGRLDWLSVLGH